jgi:hypothetical protein
MRKDNYNDNAIRVYKKKIKDDLFCFEIFPVHQDFFLRENNFYTNRNFHCCGYDVIKDILGLGGLIWLI